MESPSVNPNDFRVSTYGPSLCSDVIAMIVEQLNDDKHTLHSLSLVSREWLYPSQSHLFHTLTLPVIKVDCSEKLINLANNFGAHLAGRVREFILTLPRQKKCFSGQPQVNFRLLLLALQTFTSLHSLVLRSCRLREADLTGVHFPMRRLKTLTLDGLAGSLAAYNALFGRFQVYGSLSLLDSFTVDEPDYPHTGQVVSILPSTAAGLGKLSVGSAFLDWRDENTTSLYKGLVLAYGNDLTSLDIGYPLCQEGSELYDIMKYLMVERGSKLTRLRLRSPYVKGPEALSLTECCPSLQFLHITIYPTLSPQQCFKQVAYIVSTAPNTLREIQIGIQTPPSPPYPDHTLPSAACVSEDLDTLDRVFSQLSGLKSVLFHEEPLGCDLPPADQSVLPMCSTLREPLLSALPLTHSSGRLQFFVGEFGHACGVKS